MSVDWGARLRPGYGDASPGGLRGRAAGRERRNERWPAAEELQVVPQASPAPGLDHPLSEGAALQAPAARRAAAAIADAWRQNVSEVRPTAGGGLAANVVLSVQVDGDEVDLDALAADRDVERALVGARDLLAEALSRKGLRLRRFRSRIGQEDAAEPSRPPTDEPAPKSRSTRGAPRRSFIKVIA